MFKNLDALKFSSKVATIKNHRPLLYLAENAKEGKPPSISQTTGAKQILYLIPKAKRPHWQESSTSRTYSNIFNISVQLRLQINRYKKT